MLIGLRKSLQTTIHIRYGLILSLLLNSPMPLVDIPKIWLHIRTAFIACFKMICNTLAWCMVCNIEFHPLKVFPQSMQFQIDMGSNNKIVFLLNFWILEQGCTRPIYLTMQTVVQVCKRTLTQLFTISLHKFFYKFRFAK